MRAHKAPDQTSELNDIGGRLRLFVEAPLCAGAKIVPGESQAHYLLRVMRARDGDCVRLFNGKDGEWRARISEVTRRSCTLICDRQMADQDRAPDLWLAFAPIKKTPAEYLVQKATELGAALLLPVVTERTVARRVNVERLRANAIEAAEQSGRLTVPEIHEAESLPELLRAWPPERGLLFCDEAGDALPIADALSRAEVRNGWGVLTGPEGGFSPAERHLVRAHPAVLPVMLGPRIMRADTAALAALAVWQAIQGDWHEIG
jgi:16S rRNA (uracil1498-N3)-methyltransferase